MSENERIVLQPRGDVNIKIDVNLIPEYQRCQLAEATLEATKRFFSQPGVEERYQSWLQKRQEGEKK